MTTDPWLVGYLAGVVGAALFLTYAISRGLSRTASIRRTRVRDKKRFDVVETDTPLADPRQTATARAIESIDAQFTVTRRVIVPMVWLVALGAVVIPFLDKVPAAAISILVTGVTLIVGVAARPYLENAFAGVVLSHSKALSIGDTVKFGDNYGTVEDITTTHTTIKLWDWRRLVLPNTETIRTGFINYSMYDTFLWASVEFYVAYEADIAEVEAIAKTAAVESAAYVRHEEPRFWVMGMEKDCVRCMVAAWANSAADAWDLTHDIRSGIMREFHQREIWARVPERIHATMNKDAATPV